MKNNLSRLRKRLSFTQDEVCNQLEISKKSLYNYEHGKKPIPSDVLVKLSQIYQCSVDYILGIKKYTTLTITDKKGEVIAVLTDTENIEHSDYRFLYSDSNPLFMRV